MGDPRSAGAWVGVKSWNRCPKKLLTRFVISIEYRTQNGFVRFGIGKAWRDGRVV